MTTGIIEAQLLREQAFEQKLAPHPKVCACESSGAPLDDHDTIQGTTTAFTYTHLWMLR